MKNLTKGIFNENPVLVSFLGMCPVLAITTTLENAIVMGIAVIMVLICTNFIVSLIRKLIPTTIRIPVYIVIIATFVSIIEMLMNAYTPTIARVLGIYIPLIVVNCIILGRAEAYASKNSVGKSIVDGIGMGLGFTFAIMLLASIREILGTGKLTIIDNLSEFLGFKLQFELFGDNMIFSPAKLFINPAGAFITLGFIVAFMNYLRSRKEGAK